MTKEINKMYYRATVRLKCDAPNKELYIIDSVIKWSIEDGFLFIKAENGTYMLPLYRIFSAKFLKD